MRLGLIYCIRNTLNNKVYVGKTVDLVSRRSDHLFYLRKGQHHSSHLQRSWNLHGKESFIFEILEDSIPLEILSVKEAAWCSKLNALDHNFGYNTQIPQEDGSFTLSEETKEILRKKAANQFSEEQIRVKHAELTKQAQGSQLGSNNRFYGKKHSEEVKALIREKRKDQKIVMTEERKRKISESNKRTKSLKKRNKKDDIHQV
jgi:group I intron endonuclease